jgi:hypothetical protein
MLVLVEAAKIDRLQDALGRDAEAVTFADVAEVGANPARIIPAWRAFVGAADFALLCPYDVDGLEPAVVEGAHRSNPHLVRGGAPPWHRLAPCAPHPCQRRHRRELRPGERAPADERGRSPRCATPFLGAVAGAPAEARADDRPD